MEKNWQVQTFHQERVQSLSQELNIHPLIIQILLNRGIEEKDPIHNFLYPSLKNLHSPFHMKDMDRAVDRIIRAILNREAIVIYGDYDADGITSTALLLDFLRELDADVSYYIPHRLEEGYGLNKTVLYRMAQSHTRLVITVDCGIGNNDEVAYTNTLGLDVIVTDHHEVPSSLPKALAILNPKQPGCPFSFKDLAGVGVVFNLIIALRAKLRKIGFWKDSHVPNLKKYLDLVALGTVADMVPLIDENRIFVKIGLILLSQGLRPGVAALKDVSGLETKEIDAWDIAFKLAPRINAAGRIGEAYNGVELLTARDITSAKTITQRLNTANAERQRIEEQIMTDAFEYLKRDPTILEKKSLLLASEKWHPGVIGIVASRLVEQYHRPVILISLADGMGKGSGRSIREFNLYEGLKSCNHLLERFGGHKCAAGLTVLEENIQEFYGAFEAIVAESLSGIDLLPKVEIDSVVSLNHLTGTFLEHLSLLPPFGSANPEPVFCTSDFDIAEPQVVGNNHLKFKISQNHISCEAIGYNMGYHYPLSQSFQIAFIPQLNTWQGKTNLQLKLKDIKINI